MGSAWKLATPEQIEKLDKMFGVRDGELYKGGTNFSKQCRDIYVR
jgi:hypothetical protein